ncbi:hypothetical protein Cch01nite_18720 [Cellulomonas chitinilytica]|uniref:Uncharacterized protein n=1 Tax=Cellulomonas chitinilytica TaxID=398759 RepID=A0A919P3D9_9CELL|nr:hypothetical protein [Cellulomonas chitinilytica]GIG21148.1 hypothetical protein Cch01nite_18720 [Cellulomonas chitinilytica]
MISKILGPVPATLAATVLASLVAASPPWATLAMVVGLFGGTLLAAIGILRWLGGPGSLTRHRAVPVVLAAEVLALVAGWLMGLPSEVIRAFIAFFVVGLVTRVGARANISAHCLFFGTLTGLLLGWIPIAGMCALALLMALAAARVALRQHTAPQALWGGLGGIAIGALAAAVFA